MDTNIGNTETVPPGPSPSDGPLLPSAEGVEEAAKRSHFEKLERRRFERHPSRDCRQNGDLIASVLRAAEKFGEDRLVTFTLTFRRKLPYPEATLALKRLRPILEEEFLGWMWAVDITRQGAWHFHCFGIVPFSAQQGLDRSAMAELRRLEKLGRVVTGEEAPERRRLRKIASSNPDLRSLRSRIEKRTTACGFGWKFEVTPIWTTTEYAAKYLVKGIVRVQRTRQSLADERRAVRRKEIRRTIKDHSLLPPGARLFGFAGDFPRVRITEPTPGMLAYRAKLAAVQQALSKTDIEMCNQFGRRWKFRFGRVIRELEYYYGCDLRGWDVDKIGACVREIFPIPEAPNPGGSRPKLPAQATIWGHSVTSDEDIYHSILVSEALPLKARLAAAAYFKGKELEWWRNDAWEQWLAESEESDSSDSEGYLQYLHTGSDD